MKLLISATVAAVLTAGSSFAQSQPESPVSPPSELTTPAPPAITPAPEADAERDQTRAERRREREMRWRRAMRDGGHHGQRHWRNGRNGPDAGARFRIEVGEDGSMKFDITCDADEPIQACADVMMNIFDRLDPDRSNPTSDEATDPTARPD